MVKTGNKKTKADKVEQPPAQESPEIQQVSQPKISDFTWKHIQNEYVFCKEPQTAKAMNTANKFAQEPKTDITVFPTADEPDQKVYWGGINGFFFAVVVGVSARVPKSIADHIRNSRMATKEPVKTW